MKNFKKNKKSIDMDLLTFEDVNNHPKNFMNVDKLIYHIGRILSSSGSSGVLEKSTIDINKPY